MKSPLCFSQAKCCEAVIQHLEKQLARQRSDMLFPEKSYEGAPVDMVFNLGEHQFALEHTGIEPFENHVKLSSQEEKHFGPIIRAVNGRLPLDAHFVLYIDALALNGRSKNSVISVQDKIVAYVLSVAERLSLARLEAYWQDKANDVLPGTSIHLSLHRIAKGGGAGELSVVHLASQVGFEAARLSRIQRALTTHAPKLADWKLGGARTILVLEENDRWLSNHWLISAAYLKAEASYNDVRPDEVYLVGTANETIWFLNAIRIDDTIPEDLSIHGGYAWEICPDSLS